MANFNNHQPNKNKPALYQHYKTNYSSTKQNDECNKLKIFHIGNSKIMMIYLMYLKYSIELYTTKLIGVLEWLSQ